MPVINQTVVSLSKMEKRLEAIEKDIKKVLAAVAKPKK